MRTARVPHVVNGVLLVLLIAGSLWVYPTLPEQIPTHFGLFGEADAYGDTTLVGWMLLPFLGLFMVASLYGPAWMVKGMPTSWVNVPNRAQYEALSSAKKKLILGLVQRALYWMATAVLVLLIAVQVGAYVVATTAATGLPSVVMGSVVAGLLFIGGIIGWFVWGLPRRIRALSDGEDASGGTDDSGAAAS